MVEVKIKGKCLCCESFNLTSVMQLVNSPLTDSYSNSLELSTSKKTYPLELLMCNDCKHLQLDNFVPVEESYHDYLYNSKITPGINKNFHQYAQSLQIKNIQNSELDLLDVGSNDGSFLEACSAIGLNAIGVEPAKSVADYANKLGRKTVISYLDNNLALIFEKKGYQTKFDVITFNNVLANIENPIYALQIAKKMLKNKHSRIVIQTGYHPIQFSKGLFDYIYHEHFSYFSISSMTSLCKKVGLKINSYEKSDLRGGSIRFYLENINYSEYFQYKSSERFNSRDEFDGLYKLIETSKNHLHSLISKYKKKGFSVIGYGASHSTGILVHHMRLQNEINYLVDENQQKISLYMPGTGLKVYHPQKLFSDKKSVVIILAWQYFDLIREKLIKNGYEGDILRPIIP